MWLLNKNAVWFSIGHAFIIPACYGLKLHMLYCLPSFNVFVFICVVIKFDGSDCVMVLVSHALNIYLLLFYTQLNKVVSGPTSAGVGGDWGSRESECI